MINLHEETLDELLFRLTQECVKEQKRINATSGGTEQFEEQMEKYQRKTFDDEER